MLIPLFLLLLLPAVVYLPMRFLLDARARDNNTKQLTHLPAMQKELMKYPRLRSYEMAGLFLGAKSLPLFVGPGERDQMPVQKNVINHFDPHIVFPHIRFFNFNGFFEDRFSRYVDLGSKVKGRALEIPLKRPDSSTDLHQYVSVETLFFLLQLLMDDKTLNRAHFFEPLSAQVEISPFSLLGEDLQLRPTFSTQSLHLESHRDDLLRMPLGSAQPFHLYALPHFYSKEITDFMDLNNYDFGW